MNATEMKIMHLESQLHQLNASIKLTETLVKHGSEGEDARLVRKMRLQELRASRGLIQSKLRRLSLSNDAQVT
jgi:hypothetical protein